jgi:hypothetical protein
MSVSKEDLLLAWPRIIVWLKIVHSGFKPNEGGIGWR